jgi:hypothetical protein
MDGRRFDTLARTLSASGTRRSALAALLTGSLGLLGLPQPAEGRKRRGGGNVTIEGPCGDGSRRDNSCERARDCCTGICKRKRCRCRHQGGRCTATRNCCQVAGQALVCDEGTCKPSLCDPACGACERCVRGACEADPLKAGTCCAGDTGVCAGGVCAPCASGQACDGGACCTTAGNTATNAVPCCDALTECTGRVCKADCCDGVSCGACRTCAGGECVADATQEGQPCNAHGGTCLPNGTCITRCQSNPDPPFFTCPSGCDCVPGIDFGQTPNQGLYCGSGPGEGGFCSDDTLLGCPRGEFCDGSPNSICITACPG